VVCSSCSALGVCLCLLPSELKVSAGLLYARYTHPLDQEADEASLFPYSPECVE
jgi:hypothetical protein